MSYLIVVAHPDDEVLGAGGIIWNLTQKGVEVNVCVMSGLASARTLRPSDEQLVADTEKSMQFLGVNKRIMGDFPNIKLNTVPHLELVQFIEKAILETNADVIITHHPADLNNDHLHTSLACQAASRLFQRRKDIRPLKQLLYMEVLSATEWSMNKALGQFNPNTYVEIGEQGINKKLEALSMYRDVMREYPHPRSAEALRGLATYRGGQSGCNFAEAFECVFRRVEDYAKND